MTLLLLAAGPLYWSPGVELFCSWSREPTSPLIVPPRLSLSGPHSKKQLSLKLLPPQAASSASAKPMEISREDEESIQPILPRPGFWQVCGSYNMILFNNIQI